MNILQNKLVTVIYNTRAADYEGALNTALAYWACPSATMVNLDSGTTSAAIDTLINNAVVSSTQDYVIVACTVQDTHVTDAVPDFDNLSTAFLKLKVANRGTEVATGTSAGGGNSSTSILVATGVTGANDKYNGTFVTFSGASTHLAYTKRCLDWTLVGTDYEVGGAAVAGAFDNTDVFHIWNANAYLMIPQSSFYAVAGATYFYTVENAASRSSLKLWKLLHSTNTVPDWLGILGNYGYYQYAGTASAGAATTISAAAATLTANAHVGEFVYIIGGTGVGQWAEVASNTTQIFTCKNFNGDYGKISTTYNLDKEPVGGNAAWTTNPDNTSVFRVIKGYGKILWDVYVQMYVRNYLRDTTNALVLNDWKKLVDTNDKLSNSTYGSPVTDLEYFYTTVLPMGKAAFDSSIVNALTTVL